MPGFGVGPLLEQVAQRREMARVLLSYACDGDRGRSELDPVYVNVTEGRDTVAGYSSCGDLAHWLLYRLGIRCAFVNRAEHKGWKVGANVSALAFAPMATSVGHRVSLSAGDIAIVWSLPHGFDAHVLVARDQPCTFPNQEGAVLRSAEYGQPGGALRARLLSLVKGRIVIGNRALQKVLSLSDVMAYADARGELVEPDYALLGELQGSVYDTEPAPPPAPEAA